MPEVFGLATQLTLGVTVANQRCPPIVQLSLADGFLLERQFGFDRLFNQLAPPFPDQIGQRGGVLFSTRQVNYVTLLHRGVSFGLIFCLVTNNQPDTRLLFNSKNQIQL